ncbi:MAG TPA: CoA transferase, partial [Vicinamibacteria bacterium]
MKQALEGIRVLDATQVMAGPFCTMLLGDLGADVIKVEPPDGDTTRTMAGSRGTESPGFWSINRNKRGIVLDLKDRRGQEVFRALAGRADILVENYRPGAMDALSLGYEELHSLNPGLVYASISGFGATGPYASRGGFDLVAQGMSGIMSVTGEAGRAPAKCGVPLTDLAAGLLALQAILAAHIHR